jgi:hypothetical protein
MDYERELALNLGASMNNFEIPKRPENKFEIASRRMLEQREKEGKPPLRQTIVIGDRTFDSKEEAKRYMRRESLLKITDDEDLADWLLTYQAVIEDAFWASDNRLGDLNAYLASIPHSSSSRCGWLMNHRPAVLRAFALGHRHDLDNSEQP